MGRRRQVEGFPWLRCLLGMLTLVEEPHGEEGMFCDPLPPIDNGVIVRVNPFHKNETKVLYKCDIGFTLIGKRYRTCEFDGKEYKWNGNPPKCKRLRMTCTMPPKIHGGSHNGTEDTYLYGTVIKYSCKENFTLFGTSYIFCDADQNNNKIWKGKPPKCKVVKCDNPVVENGIKLRGFGHSYTYADNVIFECKIGYFIIGSHIIRCEEDSTWYPKVPSCKKISRHSCGAPLVFNGNVEPLQPQYEIGQLVVIRCNLNYSFLDETILMRIVCKGYNLWEPAVPLCFFRTSPDTSKLPIRNARVVKGKKKYYNPGDNVTIQCHAGFDLRGSAEIQYIGGQKWSPNLPVCSLSIFFRLLIAACMLPILILATTMVYEKCYAEERSPRDMMTQRQRSRPLIDSSSRETKMLPKEKKVSAAETGKKKKTSFNTAQRIGV